MDLFPFTSNMKFSLFHFLKDNPHKKRTIMIWYLCAFYRAQMLLIPSKKLQKRWGRSNVETPEVAEGWQYRYAYEVAKEVYRISAKTPWESKCLVQAQTARFLLHRHGVPTTLYLGVGKEDDKMVAHAWLRCGEYYVTGGNGEGYAVVAKFAK